MSGIAQGVRLGGRGGGGGGRGTTLCNIMGKVKRPPSCLRPHPDRPNVNYCPSDERSHLIYKTITSQNERVVSQEGDCSTNCTNKRFSMSNLTMYVLSLKKTSFSLT